MMFPFEPVTLQLNARVAFCGRILFNETLIWPMLCPEQEA
jgi:hypothetical protein